jgi:hypothetical protein
VHPCAGFPTTPHLILPQATSPRAAWDEQGAAAPTASAVASVSSSADANALPAAPLRACLTDYFRTATSLLPVKIFEASCWLVPPADGASTRRTAEQAPSITIAFAQSLEVVAIAPASTEAGAPASVDASVAYTMADPWGVPYPTPTTITARFAGLSMHSFSTEPFHSPSSGRLQLRTAIASEKGGKSTAAAAAAAAARSPLRYIVSATISAGRDASSDGAAPPPTPRGGPRNERFGLLVDGEYYGPFAHVQVAPCVVPGSAEPIALPLTTFFRVGDEGADE